MAYRGIDESTPEGRVLASTMRCCERWGMAKVTIDDIANESGLSRATIYRLFPGGKDVIYEEVRSRETAAFFEELDEHVSAADSLEDLVVSTLTESTRMLQADEHIQVMLASVPGEILARLGFSDVPRIIEAAGEFLARRCARFLSREQSAELGEWMTRVVLTFFFTPSTHVDLADEQSARRFARRFILPAYQQPTSVR